MKKLLTLIVACLLTAVCAFGLTACGAKGAKVGAQSSTTGFQYASYIKNVEAKGYDTPALAVEDMKNGKLDYVIVDKATASALVKDIAGIKVIDIALTSEQYAIGVDKKQTALCEKINDILSSKDGKEKLAEILNKSEDEYDEVVSADKDVSKADSQFVVATETGFKPFEYTEGEFYKGIDMELAQYIATKLGLELVIEDMAFDAVVSSLGNNGVDVAMAALTITAERKSSIDFSESYYTESQVIITLDSNTALDEAGTVLDILSVLSNPQA